MHPDALNFAIRLGAAEDNDIDPETFEHTFGPNPTDDASSYAGSAFDEEPLPTRLPVPMRSINQPTSPKPFAPDETGSIISFFKSTNGFSSVDEEQSVGGDESATAFEGTAAPGDDDEIAPGNDPALEHDFDETGVVSDTAQKEKHDFKTCEMLPVVHQILAVRRLLFSTRGSAGERARERWHLEGDKYKFPVFIGIGADEERDVTVRKSELDDMYFDFLFYENRMDAQMENVQFMKYSSLRSLCLVKCGNPKSTCELTFGPAFSQVKNMSERERLGAIDPF